MWVAVTSESVLSDSAVVGLSDPVRIGGAEDRSVERSRRSGSEAGADIARGTATHSRRR